MTTAIAPIINLFFFFSSRRRHTRLQGDWSSDVCSSDLVAHPIERRQEPGREPVPESRVRRERAGLAYPEYPGADHEVRATLENRSEDQGGLGGIVAQVRVQEEHDVGGVGRQRLDSLEAGGAIAAAW